MTMAAQGLSRRQTSVTEVSQTFHRLPRGKAQPGRFPGSGTAARDVARRQTRVTEVPPTFHGWAA
jgi:hypothetical protein